MNPRFRLLIALLAGVSALGASAAPPASQVSGDQELKIAAGALLPQALVSVRRAAGGPVLAEPTDVARRLEGQPVAVPLSAGLQRISEAYHLHWLRRGRAVVFQKRYADPRQVDALEFEEVRAVALDLHRLVRGVATGTMDARHLFNQRDFYRSLDAADLAAMRAGGLPHARLKPEQQALWKQINAVQAYGMLHLRTALLAHIFNTWDRGTLAFEPLNDGRVHLSYRFPDPENPARAAWCGTGGGFSRARRGGVSATGEVLPDRRDRLPTAFREKVSFRDGETSLDALVAAVEGATGRRVKLPAHVRSRRLLAYAAGTRADEVVAALEDLYGWSLEFQEKQDYTLGRPRQAAARDALDLDRRMRAALPPAMRLQWRDPDGTDSVIARRIHQQGLLIQAVARRSGKDWKSARVPDLDAQARRLLAGILFHEQLGQVLMEHLSTTRPRWAYVAPERGHFTLSGEGPHPLLMIRVPGPDGTTDQWGWAVGTSSLDR